MTRWVGRAFWALILVAAYLIVPSAQARQIVPMPVQAAIVYGDNTTVPSGLPAPTVYGWSWPGQVRVFDGTPPGGNWKIAEAVSEYAKGGIDIVMTTDPAQAQIIVSEQFDACGVTFGVVLGCAHMSGGTGVDQINLNPAYRLRGLAEHVGGHELGHSIGLAHYLGNGRSWMKPAVNDSTYLTRPGPIDMADVRSLYR